MQEPVDPTHLGDLEAWMERNAEGRDEANRLARAELVEARAVIARVEALCDAAERPSLGPVCVGAWVSSTELRAALKPRP